MGKAAAVGVGSTCAELQRLIPRVRGRGEPRLPTPPRLLAGAAAPFSLA